MFQPLEVTDARTLWIDSPSTERLGFQDSSRVQIDKDPVGTGDFTEAGDGFKAKLLGGMWPDDDELRLLVVGVVPGSEMALVYLNQLVSANMQMAALIKDGITLTCPSLEEELRVKGMGILRPLVQIMPAWAGQQERTIFVSSTLPRIKPETVKTAAVNSELNPDRKLSFNMFRIQVDAMLIANKQEPSDKWKGDSGHANLEVMRRSHKNGATPKEYVEERIRGRDTTPSQGPPA